jgi:DNA-binding transcriptional ArsR family regulator
MLNLDHTFAALADPKRRAIVARLVRGDATVSELAEPFGISRPAIFRHLKILENASLITNERQGKNPKCHLRREALTCAAEWIDFHRTFWNGSFDWLQVSFEQTKKSKKRRLRNRTLCTRDPVQAR